MSSAAKTTDVKAQLEETYAREETDLAEEGDSVDSQLTIDPISAWLYCL